MANAFSTRVGCRVCFVNLRPILVVLCAMLVLGWSPMFAAIASAQSIPQRCVQIEAFIRNDCQYSAQAVAYLREMEKARPGIEVQVYDVLTDRDALTRLHALSDRHHVPKRGVPTVLVAGQLVVGWGSAETTGKKIEQCLTVEVFTRTGCDHCRRAKTYIARIQPNYPAFEFRIYDIITDVSARQRMESLASQHNVRVSGLPAFHLGKQMVIGFLNEQATGRRIEGILNAATVPCEARTSQLPTYERLHEQSQVRYASWPIATPGLLLAAGSWQVAKTEPPPNTEVSGTEITPLPLTPLPSMPEDGQQSPLPPLPDEGQSDNTSIEGQAADAESALEPVDVPVFGRLDVREIGMPAFTFLIGLVDGFNPCAMWVLLFLLSLLVNLHDRRKIVAIAGTFVLVSGLAYFAFMSAWLNVFLLIGYARPAQIVLGILATVIGAIHVKDFFALHKGISLSIPESAKPHIYERVRKILAAEYLTAAVAGAMVLAVLVNTIELLCTAGLPAMYTQILTMQNLPAWQNYAYLGLYNVAYMLDDTVMLTVVVVTLSKTKLQERGGQWLKLLSGLVILMLGLAMLFRPQWLI